MEGRVYSPPYHPQSNRIIEGFHNFLKVCMSKYVSKSLEWDHVIPLACVAYSFLANEHSKESPFFLLLGRDPIVPLNSLLRTTVRYLGTNENIFSLEALKNMYQLVGLGTSLKEKGYQSPIPDRKLNDGDSVLLKDHIPSVWDPRYTGDYQIISFPRKTQVKVADSKGKVKITCILDIKYVLPAHRIISKLPDYQSFGRQSKLRINPKDIPSLKWEPTITTSANLSAVFSKLDSTTSVMDRLNPIPLVFTTSSYDLRPWTK